MATLTVKPFLDEKKRFQLDYLIMGFRHFLAQNLFRSTCYIWKIFNWFDINAFI